MATVASIDPIDPRLFAVIREIADASTADPVKRDQLVERMCRPTPGRAALADMVATRNAGASKSLSHPAIPSAHLNEAGCAPTCGLRLMADVFWPGLAIAAVLIVLVMA